MSQFCGNASPLAYCGKPLVRACEFHNAIWEVVTSKGMEPRQSALIDAFDILQKHMVTNEIPPKELKAAKKFAKVYRPYLLKKNKKKKLKEKAKKETFESPF